MKASEIKAWDEAVFHIKQTFLQCDDKARTGHLTEHCTAANCDNYSPGGKMCLAAFALRVLALLIYRALAEFHTKQLEHDRQYTYNAALRRDACVQPL